MSATLAVLLGNGSAAAYCFWVLWKLHRNAAPRWVQAMLLLCVVVTLACIIHQLVTP